MLFGTRLRRRLDTDTVVAELLAVVHQTVQPTGGWLWLRPRLDGAASASFRTDGRLRRPL